MTNRSSKELNKNNAPGLDLCCITHCSNPMTIRNFRSLNAPQGFWKLKTESIPHHELDPENTYLKICVEHYNEDLKLFPRSKRKRKYKTKKTIEKQNEKKTPIKKQKKTQPQVKLKFEESVYTIKFNLSNEPWLVFFMSNISKLEVSF
jgi:hypothetical protein